MSSIRVFVGSDAYQFGAGAERVLEHSIRKHCSRPVDIYVMRAGEPGWEISAKGENGSWRIGAATQGGWVKAPGRNWGTQFSGFRFAVPEICKFEGRAIYLDADMLVLGDIAELWDMAPGEHFGMRAIDWRRTDVSVINCEWFKDKKWWPTIAEMKPSGNRVFEYITLLQHYNAIEGTLPKEWNDCDARIYNQRPDDVKLIHYTNVMCGQPYRPYENVKYPDLYPFCLTSFSAGELWWEYYEQALTKQFGAETATAMVQREKAER